MPLHVLQRLDWHGTPFELVDLFVRHKDRRKAKAVLLTHQLGREVRLVGTQLEAVQTQVSALSRRCSRRGENWKTAMAGKGWQ